MFFILNYYSYNQKYIKALLWLALASFLAGIVTFFIFPEAIYKILGEIKDKIGGVQSFGWPMVFAIFKANVISGLSALIGGLIFGLAPLFVIIVNFIMLGGISALFFTVLHNSVWQKILFLCAVLLPHGIIELPTIFFAAVLGFRLGTRYLSNLNKGQRKQIFLQDVIVALKFIPVFFILLFVAAVIEVFVTGKLVDVVGKLVY